MNDSLYIGATGLRAQQLAVDTIANNLANVNTPGFKKARVTFDDAVYREIQLGGAGGDTAATQRLGTGVGVLGVSRQFTMGELKKTDDPFTLAVRGEGFLEVVLPDGGVGYTRGGALKVNDDGLLATADGLALSSSIRVPADAKGLDIAPGGSVTARFGDARSAELIGSIELVQFSAVAGLEPTGRGLYRAGAAAGTPARSLPGDGGAGELAQGFVESSNVSLVDEMVNLMVAQRAYELSAKLIQAADEMLAMSNNLRR